MAVTREAWAQRVDAWEARVTRLGVERAIYHTGHRAVEFPSVTQLQQDAIWPPLVAALHGTERVALDYGCGYGRWTPALGALVGEALGVDPTPALLAAAQARDHGAAVRYALLQEGRIPAAAGTFDLIWVCMVLSTILQEDMFDATVTELRRVAKPGALICLTDNTSTIHGQPVRSSYSRSRTVDEYQAAFPWADLRVVGGYVDLGEINTVFTGRVRA